MGSKDPFNFDDIYKEAGVDNLFVKKTMAEQKAMSRPTPATPPRPQPQQATSVLATSPGGLGQLHRPAAASAPMQTGVSGSKSKPSSASNLAGLDDPFAELGGISKPPPMASQKAPVRSSTPPKAATANQHALQPSAAAAAAAPQPPSAYSSSSAVAVPPATHSTYDLDDMFGVSGGTPPSSHSSTSKQPAAPVSDLPAVSHHDDPFAAFDSVEGASAAVPAAQRANTPHTSSSAAASSGPVQQGASAYGSSAAAAAAAGKAAPRAPAAASSNIRPSASAPSAAPAEGQAFQKQQQQPQQSRGEQQHYREPERPSNPYQRSSNSSARQQAAAHSFSAMAAERAYGVESVDDAYVRSQAYGYGEGSHDRSHMHPGSLGALGEGGGASFNGSASGGKSWGGLLKSVTKTAATLGKKGLKAAQAGLAQLETAIDNMDKPGSSKVFGAMDRPSGNGLQQQHSGSVHQLDDVPAERVLSMAIHISELPSSKQEDALARLPPPVRQKVLALLREQAVIEGEDQLQSSSGAATAGGRPHGASHGHISTHEYKLDDDAAGRSKPHTTQPATVAVQPAAAAAPRTVPPPAAAAAVAPSVETCHAAQEEDLLGLHAPAAAAGGQQQVDRLDSVSGIDDFFSGGTSSSSNKGSSAAQRPRTAGAPASAAAAHAATINSRMSGSEGHLADLLGGGGSSSAAGASAGTSRSAAAASGVGDLMGGLEVLHVDVDVGGHGQLYHEGEGTADGAEPEIRRQLRAARAAEKHAKMKAALAEKQAKEVEEASRREQQQQHKQAHRERIESWKNKNKGNVRGLLGSLQTVLWEDSGWTPINMGDLLEPVQVRKAWMKANLLVHPDKVRQRNGSDEQVAIADMIFDALKEAWGQFRG